MTALSALPTPRASRGILLMVVTIVFMVSMDTIAKYLTQEYPVPQVVWGRYAFHMLLLLIYLRGRAFTVLRTKVLKLQLLRSAIMIATTAVFFLGLSQVPLASASAILFIGPLLVTALSMPLLGEHVGPRRWGGVCVGFLGALVILRPGTEVFELAALLPLTAAFGYAFYQIMTRMVARTAEPPMTSLVYTALLGAVFTSLLVPFFWVPPSLEAWLLMGLMGVFGGIGHFTLIKAFESAPAAVITPFGYTSIVWATFYGFFIFGELPDMMTLFGAAIIIGSGLYVFHRERQAERRT
ncbi:MAG: DMT family transporter [Rhodovibrionaceae bacterium]